MRSNIIYHSTKIIAEAFVWQRQDIATPLRALNVISIDENRTITPSEHMELSGILQDFDFSHLNMLTVVGNICVTAVISCPIDSKKWKSRPVWYIIGKQSRIERHSWGTISIEMTRYLNMREFIPEPFCRKIMYFSLRLDRKSVV